MNELAASFLTVFAGLFPIVNPLGMAPIFLRLTSDATEQTRAKLAWQIAVGGFALMAVSLFIGSHILAFFGLTIAAVQIAGGLVVMTAGWRMLQQGHEPRVREQQAASSEDWIMRRAFFPLTMPLTVGPGTISVAITLGTQGAQTKHLLMTATGGLLAAVAVAAAVYLSYRFATNVLRWLGETGTDILMRLTAFILLCLGVQNRHQWHRRATASWREVIMGAGNPVETSGQMGALDPYSNLYHVQRDHQPAGTPLTPAGISRSP